MRRRYFRLAENIGKSCAHLRSFSSHADRRGRIIIGITGISRMTNIREDKAVRYSMIRDLYTYQPKRYASRKENRLKFRRKNRKKNSNGDANIIVRLEIVQQDILYAICLLFALLTTNDADPKIIATLP